MGDGQQPSAAAPEERDAMSLLNARQQAFVREYTVDGNATQAYIRAGYSPATAGVAAHQLLDNPKIAEAVAKAQADRAHRVNVTADGVLAEMSLLANSSHEHYVVDDDGQVRPAPGAPDGCMRAIQSIKRKTTVRPDGTRTYDVEVRLWDKPNPLRLMGKQIGLFPEKVALTGPDGGPIEVARVRRVVVDPKEGSAGE